MKFSDNEIRDITNLLKEGKALPDKYRFLLFEEDREIELIWNGKSKEITNIVLPFQTIEHVDEPRTENQIKKQLDLFDINSGRQLKGWTNKLIWGDNKFILSSLKNGPLRNEIEKNGGIKLIYIDPPFDVNANFHMSVEVGDANFEKESNFLEELAFRDTWNKYHDSFLSMLYERVILARDLLSDDGSIFLHCDYRLAGKIRLLLDEVFGENSFINEIIWQGAIGDTSAKNKKFIKSHDTIFTYRKNKDSSIWNDVFQEYSSTSEKLYKYKDENGRYRLGPVDNPGGGGYQYDLGYGEKQPARGYGMPKTTALKLIEEKMLVIEKDKVPSKKIYMKEGVRCKDVWNDISSTQGSESIKYPTQKPEKLLERIINSSSNKGDLIFDFFCGSGTTAAVAEKLGRKWICADLGKFAIHTTRKRLISVQRELKRKGDNFRAFEILNLGKYEREFFISGLKDLDEEKENIIVKNKEIKFQKLIIEAYKAYPIQGFKSLIAVKNNRLIGIGPANLPLSRLYAEEILNECVAKRITKVDILSFEFEMGLFPSIQDKASNKGVDLVLKYIPKEIFDPRAIKEGKVSFHDVAHIGVRPIYRNNQIAIELTNYSVFYTQGITTIAENALKKGGSEIIVENGQVLKISKDKDGFLNPKEVLTKEWHDWIDYWSIDFDFESKKEIIQYYEKDSEAIKTEWTGSYIFENEWQSFRSKANRSLEMVSDFYEIGSGMRKIAVKVVDIFGNDTMKIIPINMSDKI